MGLRLQNHQLDWAVHWRTASRAGWCNGTQITKSPARQGYTLVHRLQSRMVQRHSDYKINSWVGLYTGAPPPEQAGAMALRLQNQQYGRAVHWCIVMIFTVFPLFHSKSQTLTLLPFNHDIFLPFTLSYLILLSFILSSQVT